MATEPMNTEVEGFSIVLAGQFNAAIFQPSWFAREGLIRNAEADEAVVEMVAPPVSKFRTAWFEMVVVPDKFRLSTTRSSEFPSLVDLVVGTFRILHHTPLSAMGINLDYHIRLETEEHVRESMKRHWTMPRIEELGTPRPLSLVFCGDRQKVTRCGGRITVRMEPSVKCMPAGLYFNINDNYDNPDLNAANDCGPLMTVLSEEWETSVAAARSIVSKLMGAA